MTDSALPRVTMGRRWSERGAAGVEAVIALPVFVLLFIGAAYTGRLAVQRANAEAEARSCAWQYSMNACDQVPPGCDGIVHRPETKNVSNAISDKLSEAEHSGSGVVGSIIGSILGSALNAAFGRSFDAEAQRSVPRPAVFGAGPGVIAGRYHLACNLAPQTMEDVAERAWKIFRP